MHRGTRRRGCDFLAGGIHRPVAALACERGVFAGESEARSIVREVREPELLPIPGRMTGATIGAMAVLVRVGVAARALQPEGPVAHDGTRRAARDLGTASVLAWMATRAGESRVFAVEREPRHGMVEVK